MNDEEYKQKVLQHLKDWMNGLITDAECVNRIVMDTPREWFS